MQNQALSGHPASWLLCGHLTCSLDARGRSVGPAGRAWRCLGSVMCWKLSYCSVWNFSLARRLLAVLCPALLQPLASHPSAVSRCFPGALRSLCRRDGDSSHSEWERSVENFPGSIPVLPCCEPDLSLPLHPCERGWFGSLGMDPGQSSSRVQLSQGSSSRVPGSHTERGSRAFALAMSLLSPHLVLLLFLCPFSGHGWTPGSHHSGWSSQNL